MQVKNSSPTQPWFITGVMIPPQGSAEVSDESRADIKGHPFLSEVKVAAVEVEAPKRGRPAAEKDAE